MNNQGKTNKDPNATREAKADPRVVNEQSEIAKKAKEQAEADRIARAKAVGLDEEATIEEIENAEFAAQEKALADKLEADAKLKEKNHKLWMLSNHIEGMFADREKTNLPKYTESEVIAAVGKLGSSANLVVKFTNDDKTKGYIEMEEHNQKVRVPSSGEFNFSFDYAKAAADMAKKNEA